MQFENAFTVDAPLDEVWATLMDIERVAPCMPGAEVLDRVDGDRYKVGVKVKLGPISMLYRGQVEVVERDDAARRATMHAKAKEARGQGTADAQLRISLTEQPDGAHATIDTQLALSGRAAAMGRGVIADVAANLIEAFASNLAAMLAPPTAEPAGPAEAAAPAVPAPQPPPVAEPSVAEPPPAAEPPSTAPPPPVAGGPARQDALPVAQLAASVIAGRLRNPSTLLLAAGGLALVSGAIGYALGRSSR